jgi:flagellar hook assembly protein FlgD
MKTSMENLVSSMSNDRMLGAASLIGKSVSIPDGPVTVTDTPYRKALSMFQRVLMASVFKFSTTKVNWCVRKSWVDNLSETSRWLGTA